MFKKIQMIHLPNFGEKPPHDRLEGNEEEEDEQAGKAGDAQVRPEEVDDDGRLQRPGHQVGAEEAELVESHAVIAHYVHYCAH